jgi:hypothetical protein
VYTVSCRPKWENRKRGTENSIVVNINTLKLLRNLCARVDFAWAELCKEKPDLKGTQHCTLCTLQLFIYDLTNEYSYRTHFCI